jgi:DNA-binding response OmpR family regulator
VVLLVEDDLVSASALTTILTRRGFNVIHAATVAEGLTQLSASPDTVILDLMLPDGDGAAVLQQLRDAGSSTRVIVTTAVHDDARLDAVRAMRPDVLLQKPIDLPSLLRVLGPLN